MNLIIIGGFLGSGKTTILLSIVKYLSERKGLKVAIVENEVGKVGVDGDYLKEKGLQVKEIYSGCICCSLGTDIIQTLLELERNYNPDVVLLEPSGVANPSEVLRCLDGYGGNIDSKQLITVIDPVRFNLLQDFSLPLITHSLDLAHLIIINKTDLINQPEILSLEERIYQINSEVKIIRMSALQEDQFNEVYENLFTETIEKGQSSYTLAEPDCVLPSHDHAVSYAKEIELKFTSPISNKEIELKLNALLTAVSVQLEGQGCKLIGHLKAIVKEKNMGYLIGSKTTFEHPVQIKGKLTNPISTVKFILNLIVYTIEKEKLKTIADKEIENIFKS